MKNISIDILAQLNKEVVDVWYIPTITFISDAIEGSPVKITSELDGASDAVEATLQVSQPNDGEENRLPQTELVLVLKDDSEASMGAITKSFIQQLLDNRLGDAIVRYQLSLSDDPDNYLYTIDFGIESCSGNNNALVLALTLNIFFDRPSIRVYYDSNVIPALLKRI